MKKYLSFLAFLVAYLLHVQARAYEKVAHQEPPFIRSDEVGFDRCGDPSPCPGRLIMVKNPQPGRVWVVVWCLGDPRTMVESEIYPSGTVTFDVGVDRPGGLRHGDCSIARWSRR